MALTGLLLCVFLIIHLAGNLLLFAGAETFNNYVHSLAAVKPLIRLIEIILTAIFLVHIIFSIKLTRKNQQVSGIKYQVNTANETSSFFSRNMGLSGSIIFIFLVTHLSTIWYRFQTQHEQGNFYEIVTGSTVGLGNGFVTSLYCVAMVLLGFHLRHGFQSAFQTFGLRYNQYGKLIEKISIIFWLIIPAGFLTIAVYFGFLNGAGK